MANYALANLIKYQVPILQQFNAGELRVRTPEVFNFLRENTELMIPSHNEIKNSAKRTGGEVSYFGRSTRALGTGGETYNHTKTKGDSAVLVPAWQPLDDGFSFDIKQANGSVFSFDSEVNNEMINMYDNFSEGFETVATGWVNSNRSQINKSLAEGTFNGTNFVFEITEDYANVGSTGYRALTIIKSNMRNNKWSGTGNAIICDTVGFNKMSVLANQGAGNDINTSFQFGGDRFIHSPELDVEATALSYLKGYFVVIPSNTTAVLDWMPVQNRNGFVGPDNVYGSLIHPATGLSLAYHEYSERADGTSINSENQTVLTQVQAFTYLSFNHSPLTTTGETPLQAFALV